MRATTAFAGYGCWISFVSRSGRCRNHRPSVMSPRGQRYSCTAHAVRNAITQNSSTEKRKKRHARFERGCDLSANAFRLTTTNSEAVRQPSRRSKLPLKRVKPGDLITAQLINQIIDEINWLKSAVTALERKCSVSSVARKARSQPTERRLKRA